ncbi:MAG: hypothetical protein JSS86_23720 [Cyanobacteria bacterium SZAS LIN-2]|nr:hypothetical protein [Cyanobacteria bacterium SZAS LIN-2]MBS2010688.1 hypothetical protein [Cyanobacteria bacterium SZAS TMP-1]
MSNINSIQRIRFATVQGGAWYGFTKSIQEDEKNTTNYSYRKPVKASDTFGGLTDKGRRIVNKLITMRGIMAVLATPFGIVLEISPAYDVADYHEEVVSIINETLFGGKADVTQLGKRQKHEGLIQWSGTRKDSTRWYGVSEALKVDQKDTASLVLSGPLKGDKTLGLTEAAKEVVNAIHALKGVFTIWVGAFDISVQIAPVFDWDDYHETIVALLKDKVLGGKAYVEKKAS